MKHKLALLVTLFILLSAFKADKSIPTIFMIGDSTMANKVLNGDNPERGWGQMLSGYLSDEIKVDNHAQNGRSSKSFIDEGRWERVISQVKRGDYVFIQFGHNDEKPDPKRHTDPGTTFDANLRRFVNETRAKGGIPVLFNSIVRRNFGLAQGDAVKEAVGQDDVRQDANPDAKRDASVTPAPKEGETLIDTHGAYLDSPRNVAKELGVAFVDMNRMTHELVESMGSVASKKLFMWIPANEVAACPKGREDNTHLNVYGGRAVARLAMEALVKVVPELEKFRRCYDFVVAQDGSGDFFTVQDAINAVPDFRKVRTTILVRKGVYKEKVVIAESKANISLIGQEGTVLTYDDFASKANCFGEEKGTSGSSSCYIYASDFYAENVTFENSSGAVGQAVACFVSGNRAYFKNCRFLGFQDTLYTYGKGCRQYYEACYIEGTVDFIFGWSTAVFNRCRIHSKSNGYVTAPSTDEGQQYGYLFYDCMLTADVGVDQVYLSRPWRPYAQAVFACCNLGKHILPTGWHNWGKKDAEKSVFYAEFENKGEGASTTYRAPFARQLKSLEGYEPETVLSGTDGWNPIKNGNALIQTKR